MNRLDSFPLNTLVGNILHLWRQQLCFIHYFVPVLISGVVVFEADIIVIHEFLSHECNLADCV
jgi:hypothetical protein